MDPSKLADRLRAIVRTPIRLNPGPTISRDPTIPPGHASPPDPPIWPDPTTPNPATLPNRTAAGVSQILGGDWRRRDGLSCFMVERRYGPETTHGGDHVGATATRLADASSEAALVTGGAPARLPFVFFDLETTGLSGGAGTCAFLVGCGGFDDDGGFVTRQFVLLAYGDERPLLLMVAAELADAGALVTFNGKSFDAPLIETRYLFHRLPWRASGLPHLDVLHPARRFWSDGIGGETPCSLQSLEKAVLGVRRGADVPGSEIPARYFKFIRTGDARPLVSVLEHNRLDLLSLAGLTARLLDLVRQGPCAARHAREALALGRVYARGGLDARARDCYQHACREALPGSSIPSIRIDALKSLALLCRRARQFEEAAAYWRQLLEMPSCPIGLACEASQALAVHHEHRVRDLLLARAFALRSLDAAKPAWNQAVQYRLARIEKKMNKPEVSSLEFESAETPRLES